MADGIVRMLVVVDVQNDYVDPKGSMYLPGTSNLPIAISDFIGEQKFDKIVFVVTAHPVNHWSFKHNGGLHPSHCITNTRGANIHRDLTWIATESELVEKGQNSIIRTNVANLEHLVNGDATAFVVVGINVVETASSLASSGAPTLVLTDLCETLEEEVDNMRISGVMILPMLAAVFAANSPFPTITKK
jgi:nicotinamidase-related amidase